MSRDIKWGRPDAVIKGLEGLTEALEQMKKVAEIQRDDTMKALNNAVEYVKAEAEAREDYSEGLKEKERIMKQRFEEYKKSLED